MNAPRIAILAAALTVSVPLNLVAQQASVVRGDRVRVTAPALSNQRLVGTVSEIGDDACVLRVGSRSPVVLPLAEVSELEVSRGQSTLAEYGAALGGTLGALAGAAQASKDADEDDCLICYDKRVGAAILFGLIGTAIGAEIGNQFKSERWEAVSLDQLHIEMTVAHGSYSTGINVRLRI